MCQKVALEKKKEKKQIIIESNETKCSFEIFNHYNAYVQLYGFVCSVVFRSMEEG